MKKLLLPLLIGILPLLSFGQSGNTAGRSLYDTETIAEIKVTLKQSNWTEALDSLRIYGKGMMEATVSVDGIQYEQAGIRYRGTASYQTGMKRNPFHISLDFKNKEQNHQGYSSIKLSSALRDPSMVREVLFSEIARKYMPAPKANYARLFINDEYIGLFVNVESTNEPFLTEHFHSTENPYFKAGSSSSLETPDGCKLNIFGALEYESNISCYQNNFDMKSDRGWTDLQEFTRVLNNDPGSVHNYLDVDEALWMHALNNVMVNLSSYSGDQSINYYLYKDDHGRFHPFVWDLNLSFGSFKNIGTGSDLEIRDLQKLDPLLHADNPYKPLISQVLKEPFYRKVYLAHMRQIIKENFDNGAYEKRANDLRALIVIPFDEDPNKSYNLNDFKNSLTETTGRRSKIPGLVDFMSKRTRFLKTHPELTSLPSTITDLSIKGRGQFENERLNSFNINVQADRFPKKVLLYYRFNEKQPYAVMTMNEEMTSELPTGVKAFSANIDTTNPEAELDFYMVAENAGAVSFSPVDYRANPRKVKLSELNK
ncbi:MAG: CotH kinase family protein [Saprospiraceae bacterium]